MIMLMNTNALNCVGASLCPKKYKKPAPSKVFVNSVRVQLPNQVKFHCVLLNASPKDDNEIQRQVKSLHCAANKLRSTFAQC